MLLADLVATSAAVASTRSRLAKVAALADCLRRAAPDEIPIVVSYLSGELRQRRTGVGWAALRDLPASAASEPRPGGRRGRPRLRAHRGAERGRLRQRAAGGARRRCSPARRRRSGASSPCSRAASCGRARSPGSSPTRSLPPPGPTRPRCAGRRCWRATCRPSPQAALTRGAAGARARSGCRSGRPVQPMLAKTAPSLEAALQSVERPAIEWKLDGVRIQVHRDGDDVALFTRTLEPARRAHARGRRGGARAAAARRDPRRRGDRAAPRRAAAAVPGDGEPRREPRRRRARCARRCRSRRSSSTSCTSTAATCSTCPRASGWRRSSRSAGRRLGAAPGHGGRRRGAGVPRRRARARARGRRRQVADRAVRGGPARRGLAQGQARAHARPRRARGRVGPRAAPGPALEPPPRRARSARRAAS